MRKLSLSILALLCTLTMLGIERSQTLVVIDGAKYYIHTVKAGETLYGLSKAYGVGVGVIVEQNPTVATGVKTEQKVRIPYVAELPEDISERKLRKVFDTHTVVKGETLYAISRRYSIPLQTLISDNPNLDPIHLRLDESILIRREVRGTEPAVDLEAQWVAYRDNLNSVSEPGYAYHIVQPGETFYSLSRRFGITEVKLSALNNGLIPADLKVGAIIKFPGVGEPQKTDYKPNTEVIVEQYANSVTTTSEALNIQFKALDPSTTLRIALLLPISVGGTVNASHVEFYQGFLLGLDSVKRAGYSVHLDVYNTERKESKVASIVADEIFGQAHLIVGPVYEEALAPVLHFAEQKGIPVISPLANIASTKSEVLFQLSPASSKKFDKIADLINGTKRLTLIYAGKTDKEFEHEILSTLGTSQYHKYNFHYDVATRGQSGSSNDLTPLLQNDGDNVFVIMSESEVDVDRIMAAMASANTNIIARGGSMPRFVVLGNTRWNRYNTLDRTMFFKNRVIFISSYHAKRDAEVIMNFDSNYIRAFGALPSLYSYRGYDSAVLFGLGMFGDIGYNMEGESYTPLQTSYIFEREAGQTIHVNKNWTRVNYNPDFTITIE